MNCHICLGLISKKDINSQKYEGYHDSCVFKFFGSLKISPFLDFNKNNFLVDYPKQKTRGMSISGIQPKLMATIDKNKLIIKEKGGKFILKPSPIRYPYLSENEHVSMLIGKLFKTDTPDLGLVKFNDGELAYLIKRFDRQGDQKLHQEDMTQILNINRDQNEVYKYSSSYEDVGKKIQEINNGNLIITLKYFKRLIFNFLIQNGDYHLKNISLRKNDKAKYNNLTPNYDSLNSAIYFPKENEMALDLLHDDELTPQRDIKGYYSQADFNELAKRLNLNQKAYLKVYEDFFTLKEKAIELIQNSFMPDKNKEIYIQHLNQRYTRLK